MTMGHNSGFSPGLLPVYFLCLVLIYPVFGEDPLTVHKENTSLGGNATLTCKTLLGNNLSLTWLFGGNQLNSSERINITEKTDNKFKISTLFIPETSKGDHGNYTCVGSNDARNDLEKVKSPEVFLDLTFPGKFVVNPVPYRVNATRYDGGHSVDLKCEFEMYYDPDFVEWRHKESDAVQEIRVTRENATHVVSNHTIPTVSYKHDGVHTCSAFDNVTGEVINGSVKLIVYGDPTVKLDHVLGIATDKIYLNWTVDPANSKVTHYFIWVTVGDLNISTGRVNENATSYIIDKGLKPNTSYVVRLDVDTKHGNNSKQTEEGTNKKNATTLSKNPVFIPNISINGFSATSVTIGWHAPPPEIAKFIHYYLLEAWDKEQNVTLRAYHSRDTRNLPYMFGNLNSHRTYIFRVRACSDYNESCGNNWSEPMAAATMDGIPGAPSNVHYNCSSSRMHLSWDPPEDRNAEIKGYTLELTGYSEYTDKNGNMKNDTWGPLSRFKSNDSFRARFDDLQPNTHYTARLSAMTRSRRRGKETTVACSTDPALPDLPPRPRWRKILDNDRYFFKMFLPKVSERNGPLCCYRIHVVRLPPHMDMKSLKSQEQMETINYEDAHGPQPILGAYIADIFTNTDFPKDSEIVIGDEKEIFNSSNPHPSFRTPGCARCLTRPHRPAPPTAAPALKLPPTTEDDFMEGITDEPVREKRSLERDYGNLPMMMDSVKALVDGREEVKVNDGHLDSEANYTVFVELIPFAAEPGAPLPPMFSEYLNQLRPAPSPLAAAPSTALEIALKATCTIAALVLLMMVIFCLMQTRRSRKLPPHAHLEMGRLPPVFRFFWPRLGGRSALVPVTPPDMPPIASADLPIAYTDRHADCDLGFQKEFEILQMLSECFPDRTTHASEARENQSKNRYPDIKAYDQTRVKLSQVDGITGSDYINANYVMGYKERKKFICAQGPTDTTVNDFWRMVWEHGLELVVMLTNLEEYSKVKCSKYWPDDARARAFGAVSVRLLQETRFSDYIVRELKVSKLPTNAEGQPIVENNGVAKRNGDIAKQDSSEASAPTSPREAPSERTVRQFHFLMWKDFAAPEHPYSILKFIKRVNEAWSQMLGRPIVVHCSAGVGRTGTLVALDCLLDQLKATGQVAVFNTIAELRRQRNFLVQSQKQYVFVYRALVEYAHYGDTEIPASRLKSSIDRLRNTPEGSSKCLMEHELEKMLNSPVAEPVKSCAAAQAEEVRSKNRSNDCLPYDRNRVMLTPIPGRDFSTYINASFIEAYDNSEGFIITQDPLPTTIFDFWRMVSEQSVATIVMLSELGEGKCPRYWDDGTAQYEHLSVQYDESECCPYYTRRQFRVTNNKTGHTTSVRQLQYQGWPTAPGHVPEVTRGLGELCDAAAPPPTPPPPPMLVHCSTGTERSALFVALSILTWQLRTERRVDVQAVARKVRSQRARTIDTVLQYEFLHRAILNYAELHNLLEDS